MNVPVTKLSLALIALLTAACGPPTRDSAVGESARLTCQRYRTCDTLDDNYASFGECRADWERRFYDIWPSNQCEDISPEQLDECHDQIKAFDCDGNVIDIALVLGGSCSRSQVCE